MDDPIRHTDRLKGCFCQLFQTLRGTPILRQPPLGSGGEDGLAEAFEQGVEFVLDTFLLVLWCQWTSMCAHVLKPDSLDCGTCAYGWMT
jgi:hypothetical protein